MFRYAIIGFGGLGKKHLRNLKELEKERKDFTLAAICGTTAEEAKKSININLGAVDVSQIDFSCCNFYQDYKEMIDKENLDFVLSVLPTYLHEEVALYALSKGIHVFSEKPMALTLEGCENMLKAARDNDKQLIIGQCLRFHPAYQKIKEYIDSSCFGKVRGASFERISQMPLWTWNNWILDCEKSGGCVLDMHVHDVDLINWFFGKPKSLTSVIKNSKIPLEGVSTQYYYDDFIVSAAADWSLPQKFPFTTRCRIDFEKASAVVENDKLIVYTDDEILLQEFDAEDAYKAEMSDFLNLVIDKKPSNITSAESVYSSVKIAMKEIESGKTNQTIKL